MTKEEQDELVNKLNETNASLVAALRQALRFLNGLEQWDNPEIRPFVADCERFLHE